MKANELMIGDWVLGLVEDNEEIGKIIAKHPARIIKIEENGDYAAQCPYTTGIFNPLASSLATSL